MLPEMWVWVLREHWHGKEGKHFRTEHFTPICRWLKATILKKKLIEEEKKKNVGGKATQEKTRGCVNSLISTDCIQLCKRCGKIQGMVYEH